MTVSPAAISPPVAVPLTVMVACSASLALMISSPAMVLIVTVPASAWVSTVIFLVASLVTGLPASSLDATATSTELSASRSAVFTSTA